jgi:broad-specificity NMP kinase
MVALASQWEARGDRRAVFLQCYQLMTANMLTAVAERRFGDNEWVERLLHRFADYYFEALACFDCGDQVPLVWQGVHAAAAGRELHVLQHLLLGVNAHINYDLVLTLHELLRPEWASLSEEVRKRRYQDHRLVNTIIAETIDRVQDEVVEQYAPAMELVDRALGRLDEKILTGLITRWREAVWGHALTLLECTNASQQEQQRRQVETSVLRNARWLEASW